MFSVNHTDTSRVSFEAAERPNFFLYVNPSGQLRLAKWQESEAFWERATFVIHRNTWIPGYDSLESHAKPGFFLYATWPRLYLLKYRHTDSFRKATLFKLTGWLHWNNTYQKSVCVLKILFNKCKIEFRQNFIHIFVFLALFLGSEV